MIAAVPIVKMNGTKNEFVIVDGREVELADPEAFARRVCASVGADGLLVALPSKNADVRMRIINADGSEAEMCGNGIRCFARYLDEHDGRDRARIETVAGPIETRILSREPYTVAEIMAEPHVGTAHTVAGFRATPVDVGNPHVVIFVDDLAAVDIRTAGPRVERDPRYPAGTNVHFVARDGDRLRVLHWERGAGATAACGTGAVACAAVAVRDLRHARPDCAGRAGRNAPRGVGSGRPGNADRRRGPRIHHHVRLMAAGLAYTDARGRVYFDATKTPLADGGVVRAAGADELLPMPDGAVVTMLPGRTPALAGGRSAARRTALGVLLPAGYTRTLLPAFSRRPDAPDLPLFGYTFACVVDDALAVAAVRTDESEDWQPRRFAAGELESIVARRLERDPHNRTLAQLGVCAREYGCFTAQNVFLGRGEAAIPVAPKCNAACVGCISEQDADSGVPAPQTRIAFEPDAADLTRIGVTHLERVEEGIVSFGQGCEGEPLLRSTTIARAIERIRAARSNGTINCNTNGSLPAALQRLIDAGLQAVRISLNSFRPEVYAAYYRPAGYGLADVLESVALAHRAGLRVSLNLLTHPGVTDERTEVEATERFLRAHPVALVQTRTLNIDPDVYFARVGRPAEPLGMRAALERIRSTGAGVGNFTHTH